jgi:ABC-2 type transport system ATP-binding protein
MNDHTVLSLNNLHVRHAGGVHAVRGVSLALPRGTALALLGANGAGKSSLINALLGLVQAGPESSGDILGSTLGKIPQELFQHIGFVADGRMPPAQWTLRRWLDYLRPLYPTWDDAFADRLVARFALPTDRRIGTLSRGQKMKAAMVGALAFRPKLLVLDEPFGGLDPLTREEFIGSLIELMSGGDWSVLVSSHDMYEVERLCDAVAILDAGRLVVHEPVETLQGRFRKRSWSAPGASAHARAPQGWMQVVREGDRWSAIETDYTDETTTAEKLVAALGVPVDELNGSPLDLRAILVAHLRGA